MEYAVKSLLLGSIVVFSLFPLLHGANNEKSDRLPMSISYLECAKREVDRTTQRDYLLQADQAIESHAQALLLQGAIVPLDYYGGTQNYNAAIGTDMLWLLCITERGKAMNEEMHEQVDNARKIKEEITAALTKLREAEQAEQSRLAQLHEAEHAEQARLAQVRNAEQVQQSRKPQRHKCSCCRRLMAYLAWFAGKEE